MISVIIPTYKRPERLLRAVKSVLLQTYQEFEVIVVDDDTSNQYEEEIRTKLSELNDSRIQYLKNERTKGGNGARNTGIVHAKGEYIAFLDDDDEWFENKLEEQLKKMQELNDEWGGCYCGWETEGRTFIKGVEGYLFKLFVLYKLDIGASSTLFFRYNIFDKVGLWDEQLSRYQDLELMARVCQLYKIGFVNKALLSVNGHNEPSIEEIKIAGDVYVNKIIKLINNANEKKLRKEFLARHYLRIALIASLAGDLKNVAQCLRTSLTFKLLTTRIYLNTVVYFVNFHTLKLPIGLQRDFFQKSNNIQRLGSCPHAPSEMKK